MTAVDDINAAVREWRRSRLAEATSRDDQQHYASVAYVDDPDEAAVSAVVRIAGQE